MAETNLRIELSTTSNDDRPIYITGNFNSWAVNDEQFRLEKENDGRYSFIFPPYIRLPKPFEYKYTRGGWKNVELDEFGSRVPNRFLHMPEGIIQDKVPRWRRNGKTYQSKLLPQKHLLSKTFDIPQLGKSRRIQLLLPHDYETSDKRYPVLYMNDAQNLFNKYSPYGNWAIDERLAIMAEHDLADIIIVGIDHGEQYRIKEFTPFCETKLGIGEGKKYLRFLSDTLKPYIDKYYKTLPEREHTGIGGSSMGGLISAYAACLYPEVFGRFLIFSPSFWVVPHFEEHIIPPFQPYESCVYLYGGANEGSSMLPNLTGYKKALENVSKSTEVVLSIDPLGTHNEVRWGVEFPRAIERLFFQKKKEVDTEA